MQMRSRGSSVAMQESSYMTTETAITDFRSDRNKILTVFSFVFWFWFSISDHPKERLGVINFWQIKGLVCVHPCDESHSKTNRPPQWLWNPSGKFGPIGNDGRSQEETNEIRWNRHYRKSPHSA